MRTKYFYVSEIIQIFFLNVNVDLFRVKIFCEFITKMLFDVKHLIRIIKVT